MTPHRTASLQEVWFLFTGQLLRHVQVGVLLRSSLFLAKALPAFLICLDAQTLHHHDCLYWVAGTLLPASFRKCCLGNWPQNSDCCRASSMVRAFFNQQDQRWSSLFWLLHHLSQVTWALRSHPPRFYSREWWNLPNVALLGCAWASKVTRYMKTFTVTSREIWGFTPCAMKLRKSATTLTSP